VREGALVVLAGLPNVGKSSLFNALLGQTRAIVTELPGTTRDAIEAVIDTPSWPLRLVDTAGLRDTQDAVERMGIEVSASYLARAAVVLACGDTSAALDSVSDAVARRASAPVILVRTKIDLDGSARPSSSDAPHRENGVVAVSAETGEGLAVLLDRITDVLAHEAGAREADTPLLTQTRHRYAVSCALDEVRAFRAVWGQAGVPAPVAAVHLRAAVTTLEDLIGAVDIDDILDEVFRRFCVGK
jgi:tRNA modification GTPase